MTLLLPDLRRILIWTVLAIATRVRCDERHYQNYTGVTPNHHSFRISSASSSALWRFSVGAADCPPGIALHAVVTLPTSAPEGKTITVTSTTGNCPASTVLCASTWKDASSDAVVNVDVVGERGVRYDLSLSPIIDRELTFENNDQASFNGTIRRSPSSAEATTTSIGTSEILYFRLANVTAGQLEISVESSDVNSTALGRKRDRKTKRPVPRFVASLVVGADCHACSHRVAMAMAGEEEEDADLAAISNSSSISRLSFTTFGRITLSRQSIPALGDGVWFVGVVPSSSRSDDGANLLKDFKLTVKLTSPKAQSRYVAPLVLVSLVVGAIFIVLDACLLYVRYREFRPIDAKEHAVSTFKLLADNAYLYLFNCACWFKRGAKTFPYLVLIFGVTLFIPGLQTIAGTLVQRWETGDLDLCYYNEKCYVAGSDYDYPQNSGASNAAYVVHGVLFVILYSFVETSCRARGHFDCEKSSPTKAPPSDVSNCDYSLAYALGWTLIFQGFFSGIYHLCPTRRAVQFDQSFMFVLGLLIVVAVFRGSLKIIDFRLANASSPSSPSSPPLPPRKPAKEMRSPKIFLFFLCPLVVFNYVGTLQNMKEISVYGKVVTRSGKFAFGFFLFFWLLCVFLWAAYKMRFKDRIREAFFSDKVFCCGQTKAPETPAATRASPSRRDKLLLLLCVALFLAYFLFILYWVWTSFRQDDDMAKTFVGTTLVSALVSVAAAEILACHFVWKQRRVIFFRYVASIFSFYVLVVVAWGFAFYFFKKENPSKKEIEPWISRERNKNCIVGGYFDGHDVWHICSSFGIFLTCIRVVHLASPCARCFKERYETPKNPFNAARAVAKWKRNMSTKLRGRDAAGAVETNGTVDEDGVVLGNGRADEDAGAEKNRMMKIREEDVTVEAKTDDSVV